MFWRKKQVETGGAGTTKESPSPKVKQLSPKETMVRQIENLGEAQSLTYRLCDSYGGGNRIATVERNSNHPGKGKKYILSTDKLVMGKPVEAKIFLMESNNPHDIADWIRERKGEQMSQEGS